MKEALVQSEEEHGRLRNSKHLKIEEYALKSLVIEEIVTLHKRNFLLCREHDKSDLMFHRGKQQFDYRVSDGYPVQWQDCYLMLRGKQPWNFPE